MELETEAAAGLILQNNITPLDEFKIDAGNRMVLVQVTGGMDEYPGNIRKETTVTGVVVRNDIEYVVGSASAVNFRDVTFSSIQPQTLTFYIPSGCTGIVRVSGGTASKVEVTQLGL